MRSRAIFAPVLLLLGVLQPCVGQPTIYDQIYTTLSQSKPCNRLLNTTGVIGCTTPRTGSRGTLRHFKDQAALDAFLSTPNSDQQIAALLPVTLFNRDTIQKLNVHSPLAGVMLLSANWKSYPPGFSHDLQSPQIGMSLHPESPYVWNPKGTGLAYDNFPFALIQLSAAESSLLTKQAAENEDAVANGNFPDRQVEFQYKMFAEVNSIECLKNLACLPVGGFSVWANMGRSHINTSLPIVVATASLDGFSLFHDAATAAEASMSGTVALLAAADALTRAGVTQMELDREVILGFFHGEKWGYVGSRNWLSEVQSFACDMMSEDMTSCDEPHREDMEFKRVNVSKFYRVLDLSQLALLDNNTVYLHNERPANQETRDFQDDLIELAPRAGLEAQLADPATPGLPPSTAQSFYRATPDIGIITMADHRGPYHNPYYGSEFDDVYNTRGDPTDPRRPNMPLCKAATLAAKAIYQSAMISPSNETIDAIHADCDLVADLWVCLTKDFSCDLANMLMPGVQRPATGEQVSHYSSVYQPSAYSRIGGTALFVKQALASMPLNFTDPPSSSTGQFLSHFHDAVDPALKFNFDTNQFMVLNATESPIWTESNWGNDVGARLYRAENPSVELFMGLMGGSAVLVSLVIVHFSKRLCLKRFKTL